MPNLKENDVVDDAWRYWVEQYAERMSEGKWVAYPWLCYVLDRVQKAVMRGNARVIINAPPRHGKSEAIAHWLPTWFLDWHPDKRVILGSYGDDFAMGWGRRVRDEFLYNKETWARVNSDVRRASNWETTEGGGMKTVGMGGAITGRGGDLLVLTDPHKNWEEVQSPTYRLKAKNWFDAIFYTRQEPDASIIIEHTRWHERDISGFLKEEHEDNWEVINLPALAEREDLLGRQEDDPLCPERYPKEQLQKIKKIQPSFIWAGLYQQRPAPLEGGMIKRDWFKRWTELPICQEWIQSWDLTFKSTGTSYVVGQVWGRDGANLYLADQIRERLSFPDTLKKIEMMTNKWPKALTKLIEAAANGPAVVETLEDSVPGIIGVRAQGSKESRLAAVSGLLEAGNVYIPSSNEAPWADDLIEEVITFPNAANDDQVDAMTQALSRLGQSSFTLDFSIPSEGARTSPWSFANAG